MPEDGPHFGRSGVPEPDFSAPAVVAGDRRGVSEFPMSVLRWEGRPRCMFASLSGLIND